MIETVFIMKVTIVIMKVSLGIRSTYVGNMIVSIEVTIVSRDYERPTLGIATAPVAGR